MRIKIYAQYFLKDYKLLFFTMAILLYASVSSPTPDNPGIIEVAVIILFIASLRLQDLYRVFSGFIARQKKPFWEVSLYILLMYGLIVPTLMGLGDDIQYNVLLRDIIGFLFLCLPLFLMPYLEDNKKRQKLFFISLITIGLLFSIRVLFLDFSFFTKKEELLYLANSPLVLFSSLYLLGFAVYSLSELSYKKILFFVLFAALAIIPMAAMYIDFQRASFIAIGLNIIFLLVWGVTKKPLKMITPIAMIIIIGIIAYPMVIDIINNISLKTSQVGLNMRQQELMAVWDAVSKSPVTLIFGQGWGTSFASPAVGGLNVHYTHSLMTYMLLKTGLIGLGLTLTFLIFVFEKLLRLVFIEPVKGTALLWPLLIPIIFYASYKSLDYGFVLTLILTSHNCYGQREKI